MCQGTARARKVSGAIRDGRWSKSLSCCLWRGNSVPLSLTEAPTAPQYQGDKTELQVALGDALQGARCPFPMSLVLSSGTAIITFPVPRALQSRMDGTGGPVLGSEGQDGTGSWQDPTALPHPCSTIPTSNHPTALIPLLPRKAD